jgi:SpoVK/Ycf46/Vps4 family AAA+-type ATPase
MSQYVQEASATALARPGWTRELRTLYNGRVARQFVLHFNISDFIVDLERLEMSPETGEYEAAGGVVGEPRSFRQYLANFLYSDLHCQAIYSYSLANSLVVDEDLLPDERDFARQRVHEAAASVNFVQQDAGGVEHEAQQTNLPDGPAGNLKILGYMLTKNWLVRGDSQDRTAPIAVLLEYAEKIVPYHLGEGHGTQEQLQSLEMVQRWGLDQQLRRTANIVILLTANAGNLASSVYAAGSGCRAIRVPLPGMAERTAFIDWKIQARQFVKLSEEFGSTAREQVRQLAKDTQGMRLSDLDNLSRRIIVEQRFQRLPELLFSRHVQREKAVVIQTQSEQLLEILQTRRGFDDIGGLDKLKVYLKVRTEQMKQGQNTLIVPSGLLLAGPPGTGKTIIAEALAKESGFNLVKMRNIQDRWIGSSERNLELVINLLKDLHPVVVFIDEIDQAMVRRDSGQSGDSGVGARMFARILEEMSTASNRGRILWVAATNRVDFLDDALLRRFDRVVPLLAPDEEEACRIFRTMPTMISRQSDGAVNVKYSGDLQQSGRKDVNGKPNPTEHDLECFREAAHEIVERVLTGAAIEIVVRRAVELACEEALDRKELLSATDLPGIESRHLLKAIKDFKPNHNKFMYDLQSLLAIRGCNFHSVLPEMPYREVFLRIKDKDGQIDTEQLDMQINALKRLVNERSLVP